MLESGTSDELTSASCENSAFGEPGADGKDARAPPEPVSAMRSHRTAPREARASRIGIPGGLNERLLPDGLAQRLCPRGAATGKRDFGTRHLDVPLVQHHPMDGGQRDIVTGAKHDGVGFSTLTG